MRSAWKKIVFVVMAVCLVAGLLWAAGSKKKKPANEADQIGTMNRSKRALHVLNRLTFGPRPGDAELLQKIGWEKWLEQQLAPETIDDSALDARLANLRTLKMDTRAIMENFPPPEMIKAVAEGRQPMPSDPAKRAVYEKAIEQYEARNQLKQEQAAAPGNPNASAANSGTPPNANPPAASNQNDAQNSSNGDMNMNSESALTLPQKQAQREARMYAALKASEILNLPPDQRYQELLKMTPEELQATNRALNDDQREQLLSNLTPQQRETIMAFGGPQRLVDMELMQGKILRAAYSEKQLQEVMTDFWFNHFNIFINKGVDHYFITSYERDVIRPHSLGKFKDLLLATAQSPAMLFYLDNWQSVGPDSDVAKGIPPRRNPNTFGHPNNNRPRVYMDRNGVYHARMGPPPGGGPPRANNGAAKGNAPKAQERRGLNENYAREIMELHTLGVDGGYTQNDVTELAKILTGWTIEQPQKGGGFTFNERMHQPGKKMFLGQIIKENGKDEGLKVIDLLAHHPATARFICRKLAMRFVSDDPPPALVERMAQTFTDSDGDIKEVLRTLFHSPEFWAADDYRAKVKTPLEFVASAVRATGADITNPMPLVQTLNRMGMPLYGMQPPTGYSMKADAWVNSSALLNRMNFALTLASGKLHGVMVNQASLLGPAPPPADPSDALAMLEGSLLSGDISPQTHAVIQKQLDDPQVTGRTLDDPARLPNYGVIAGLLIGSPEFQKR